MIIREMIRQSLPLLVFCGLGGIVAGSTLTTMVGLLESIPGLLVVIPAIIAIRGNISTAFGSRLGSAYHLGLIDAQNLWNEELWQNVVASLLLSFFVSLLIGILAYFTSLWMGVTPDVVKLITIVLLAGVISALILTMLTIIVIYLVFRRGYDPDNITGPALATFGDIFTMFSIYGSALLVEVVL